MYERDAGRAFGGDGADGGNGGRPKVLSLFSGCGGMDIGFEQAGHEIVAANDAWEPAVRTHAANFPRARMVPGDITDPAVQARIVEACGGGCGIIIGGPPCVAFSTSGRRDPNDPRGRLFEHYIDMVARLRPAVVAMENVVGILTPRKGEDLAVIERITAALSMHGYRSKSRVLNAADYGVPQTRRRVIVVGTRLGVPILFPWPTHAASPSPADVLLPWATMRDAIDDLKGAPEDEAWSHVFTRHSPDMVRRFVRTPVWGFGSKNYQEGYRKVPADSPSVTLKTVAWPIHYAHPRTLTAREAARVQGFPDWFKFVGGKVDVARIIGNAVPPPLARAIGTAVLDMLEAGRPAHAQPSGGPKSPGARNPARPYDAR